MKKIDSAQHPLKRWVIKGKGSSLIIGIYSEEKPEVIEDKTKKGVAGTNWFNTSEDL